MGRFTERVGAPTPKKNKIIGMIATAVGIFCGTILTAGVVTAPLGIAILAATAATATGIATYSAQRTVYDDVAESPIEDANVLDKIKNN